MSKATLLADRAVVCLTGEGVRQFLQGLVTNDVTGALPVWAGLLTPQGKALFDFIIWPDSNGLLIDCEAAQVEPLIKRLLLYRLRRAIAIERDDRFAVHWSLEKPDEVASTRNAELMVLARDPRHERLGWRWLGPAIGADASDVFKKHRLSLGIAEGVAELGSDKTLWLETNAAELNGVSFTKGCYIGQENTARMNYRHKVLRRLFVLADGTVERRPADKPGEDALVPAWLENRASDKLSKTAIAPAEKE